MPAGSYGGEIGEGAAAAADELVGRVGLLVGERVDERAGVVGGGEDGAVQDVLAPVLGGTGWLGEDAERFSGLGPGVQQAALLSLPQYRYGVDGSMAPDQGRSRTATARCAAGG